MSRIYRNKHKDKRWQFLTQHEGRWFTNIRVAFLDEPNTWYWGEVTFPLKDGETMEMYLNRYQDESNPLEFLLVTGDRYRLPNLRRPHRPQGAELRNASIQK